MRGYADFDALGTRGSNLTIRIWNSAWQPYDLNLKPLKDRSFEGFDISINSNLGYIPVANPSLGKYFIYVRMLYNDSVHAAQTSRGVGLTTIQYGAHTSSMADASTQPRAPPNATEATTQSVDLATEVTSSRMLQSFGFMSNDQEIRYNAAPMTGMTDEVFVFYVNPYYLQVRLSNIKTTSEYISLKSKT